MRKKMTIDEIKQALSETKGICENRYSCIGCPFRIIGARRCPIGISRFAPCNWKTNWPECNISGKQDATGQMSLNDYQRMARRTAGTKQKSDKMEEALFGLAGEVGELCDHYKKYMHQGHDLDYDHMAEEAGDVMWYLAEIADALGITLEEIARRNIDKLRKRYPDGFDPERSRNREGEHEDHP